MRVFDRLSPDYLENIADDVEGSFFSQKQVELVKTI